MSTYPLACRQDVRGIQSGRGGPFLAHGPVLWPALYTSAFFGSKRHSHTLLSHRQVGTVFLGD